jgi:hypothetical protein
MLTLLTAAISPHSDCGKGSADGVQRRSPRPYFHQPFRLNRCLALLNSSLPRISACRASQLAAHLSFSEGSQMRSERMLTTSAASPHMSATPQGTLVAGTAQPQQAGHTYSGHSQTNSYPSNNLQGHNFQDTVAWPALPAPSSSHVTTPAVPAQVATQLPYCPSPEEFMAAWPNKDTMNPQSVAIMPALFATLPPEYQSRFWTAMQEGTVHQFRHVPTSNNATQQHSTPNAAVLGSGGQPWAYQPMTYTQTADIPSALWSAPAAPATVPAIPAQAVSQSNWSIQPMESPIVTPTTLMNIRLRQSMARTLYHQFFSQDLVKKISSGSRWLCIKLKWTNSPGI